MENPKYNCDKWMDICNITLNNYANMERRLSYRQKVSNLILVYYSIFLIICSLTGKYFPEHFNLTLAEYFNIVLSIVLLAYSLINSNANYVQRISKITESINKLKTIKRDIREDTITDLKKQYYNVTDTTEYRSDIDFFRTIKNLCKENDISWMNPTYIEGNEIHSKIKNYLSECNPKLCQVKILFEYSRDLLLFILPILVFILCIKYKYFI